jgi:hypothetical protein
MTVLPLSYAGGQRPAYNLTLMPGLVKNHDHAARLNESPFMEEDRGDHGRGRRHGARAWLPRRWLRRQGQVHHRARRREGPCRPVPPGKAFEQMLAGAGASITSMASSEIYNAMQTGVLTRPTPRRRPSCLPHLRAGEACYTPAGDYRAVVHVPAAADEQVDLRRPDRRAAGGADAAAAKAEAFYLEEAKKQDAASVEVFKKAGVEIAKMTPRSSTQWRELAKETSYKNFVEETPKAARPARHGAVGRVNRAGARGRSPRPSGTLRKSQFTGGIPWPAILGNGRRAGNPLLARRR